MALVNFNSELEAASSVMDLARRLGKICLEEGALTQQLHFAPKSGDFGHLYISGHD